MNNKSNEITSNINSQSNKNEPYIKFEMSEIPQSAKTGISDSDKTKQEESGNEDIAGCLCCVAFCEIFIVCLSGCNGGF